MTRSDGQSEQSDNVIPVRGLASTTDALNRDIIRALQEDGRRPFADIANELDVSEGTIRNRVNGMREAGQMRIVAIVDPSASEYRTDAMLGLKAAAGTRPAQLAERLSALPEVIYVLWVSGRFDLLVEIVCDERDQLLAFMEEHIHDQRDIGLVETMTGLKNFKNQFLLKQNWQ